MERAAEPIADSNAERTVRISRRWFAADAVVAIELQAIDGGCLPAWAPGAHIDLVLPTGTVRQYSLCGDVNDRTTWRVAILRENDGRGGSLWIHDNLAEGDIVSVRGPRNHFRLDAARQYIFICGGIGITPILPMVAEAHASGADYRLAYAGRSRTSMAFLHDLDQFMGRVELYPREEAGRVNLDRLLADVTDDTLIYCCGPSSLLDAVEERTGHWPPGSVRTERFRASDAQVLSSAADQAFEVELAVDGRVLEVPADRTLLSVLEDAGADVVSSCGEGTCGSCETPVLSGDVDHRDSVLTPAEQAEGSKIMICVSRCRGGRLVLDV
ncbi:MAG: oxidoreductase [Hyphomicrobiales bacterium]|nr:MAG: oxidoreductase [Hyphomicrobiales bacterium]